MIQPHFRGLRVPDRMGWTAVLVVAAALAAATGIATFAPGFMSNDTLYQLRQAQGVDPLTDWHPPVMSLAWRLLIAVTGTYAAMAVVQQVVLWTSLCVVAAVVHRMTGSRWWSMAFLALGLVPPVVSFSGVVWKDVQMAQAMLAATAIVFLGLVWRRRPAWVRWVLVPLAVLLLVYALLVRKNAAVAMLPMVYLVYRAWFPVRSRRALAAVGVGFVVTAVVASALIGVLARPQATDQLSALAIDDVIHVLPPDAIEHSHLSPRLRDKLLSAQATCLAKKSLTNNYWTCYGRGEHGAFSPIADHAELSAAWPGMMAQHPVGYVQYRIEVYTQFLFNNRDLWQDGVLSNSMGITVDHPRLVASLRSYVLDFGVRNLPWLFGAWFWLGVSVLQSLRWRPSRTSPFGVLVPCLGLSSFLYIAAYFPTAPATDFRYVYWPVVAGSLGLLVMALERWGPASTHGARDEVLPPVHDAVRGEAHS
ncbi:hypothetical protein ABEG17_03315 [Pedococcus sp. KACC 23699]|uniref:Glycosyltransferase RgtA/B/C/D-like domain-containing protein n=1 Tax=Pedococcus sp. KACC 23699 TaxID=3149228 RepID=A0AAU7JW09_9MICO